MRFMGTVSRMMMTIKMRLPTTMRMDISTRMMTRAKEEEEDKAENDIKGAEGLVVEEEEKPWSEGMQRTEENHCQQK